MADLPAACRQVLLRRSRRSALAFRSGTQNKSFSRALDAGPMIESKKASTSTGELAILGELEKKVLWLASWTIHHANHLARERRRLEGARPPGVVARLPPS